MNQRNDVALLIVAHGSTVNPDSSAPTLTHAAEIRRRNVFADVACAFWKEEPSLRDTIFLFDPKLVREVYETALVAETRSEELLALDEALEKAYCVG